MSADDEARLRRQGYLSENEVVHRPASASACVECRILDCPTEGMTLDCPVCHSVVCAGHTARHTVRTGHEFDWVDVHCVDSGD